MNYPFLGYNTPGLQLGQDNWMNATTPSYASMAMSPSSQIQPFADIGTPGTTSMNYQGLGFDGLDTFQSTPAAGAGFSNWMSSNADLLKAGVGLVTGGLGAWNGLQQNRLMRDNMRQQSSMFREQMNLSKSNYNSQLEDRQRARVASNPTAYESVDSYMKKYGAK